MKASTFQEMGRFCCAGGATFLLDYGLLYSLTEYAGIPYLYSAAAAFALAVLANYWLCVKYVFPSARGQDGGREFLFFASSVAGLGINQACMYFLVEVCAFYYMYAKIAATIVVTAWNYVMKRKAVRG